MILNMQQDDTRKWIACVVASSDGVLSEKFNQMVNAPGWNDRAIDFSITMNGVVFTELDDLFDRLHNHFTEQNERIAELESQRMKQNNFVAKHMNSFNRASVVPDKRDKYLADEYEKEMDYPSEEDEDDCIPE